MRETIQELRHKGTAFKAVVIFLVAYPVFLVSWIQVKDYYGTAVTVTASKLLTLVADVTYESFERTGDTVEVTYSPLSRPNMLVDIPIKTSSYTFNAPLTFALMATLWLFLKKKPRAYGEALIILLCVHFLYVFSLESKTLTETLIQQGAAPKSDLRLFVTQFFWSFTDNMVIRFEPFLIGFYMFIRFRK
ncbi:MAG: hypothetical protein M0Z60_12370 [Nitrospiraceae bacterium]|nr:hypothetical protein [Nitrospiraceae bacterium]